MTFKYVRREARGPMSKLKGDQTRHLPLTSLSSRIDETRNKPYFSCLFNKFLALPNSRI